MDALGGYESGRHPCPAQPWMPMASGSQLSCSDPAGDWQPSHHDFFCFEEAEMEKSSKGAACAAEHQGCKNHSGPPKS